MKLFGRELRLRKLPAEPKVPIAAEVAWAQDALFNFADFPKYNPDDLIGKKGFAIYRKMMLDEQIKAVVRFKRDAITSRSFLFDVDRAKLGDKEADRREAICDALVDNIQGSFTDGLNGILSSMYQGFSMTEKIFGQFNYEGKTYWGLDALKLRPFDTFQFNTDNHGSTEEVTQKIGALEQTIDLDKFIHFVHNPEYDEHYGQSELRECYRSWLSKDAAIKFWNMWLERHASGFKWIVPVGGKTLQQNSSEYISLKNVMDNSVNGAGMLLPSNVEMNVEFPANNVAFKEAMETHDLSIAKALLVPNLMGITPAGQTGSFSQSNVQVKAFFWTLHADSKRLEEALNEQVFKELGRLNFGDEYWPRFKFNPLTEEQVLALLESWNALLQNGGVTHTDTDEAFIRDLMGFPDNEDSKDSGGVSEKQALSGAQVSSLVEVIAKVGTGEVAKSSALEIIVSSFPVDRDRAEAMLKDIEEGSVSKQPAPTPGQAPTAQPSPPPAAGQQAQLPDETIRGKGAEIIHAAFTRAAKRVDFSVIGNASQALEKEHADKVAMSLHAVVDEYLTRFRQEYPTWEPDKTPAELTKMKFDAKLTGKLNRTVAAALQDGWQLGRKHASIEIDKAKNTNFSASVDNKRIELISEDFFKIKAFKVAGDLTDDAKKKIETIIINGAQTGKTAKQVEDLIYAEFATAGLLAIDVADSLKEAIGAGITNPQARIDTMIRTNMFSAINEARYSYFTDPSLGGFVEAMEYSAILDTRTTQICQHLDGQIHAADSEVWQQYRPPNHYNCRSLLIPVTTIDNWAESEQPTVEPQRGFA